MSLLLTLVRHGESTDNLKSLWAGHRDASLTNHGMNQARRLGRSLRDVRISKIYASDLKRAHWTALQIAAQNRSLLAKLAEEDKELYLLKKAVPSSSDRASNGHGDAHDGTTNGQPIPEDDGARLGQTSSGPSTPKASDRDTHKVSAKRTDEVAEDENTTATSDSESEIAETSAGPCSFLTTDRIDGDLAVALEYEDDFTCSSSAPASSPLRGSSSSAAAPSSSTLAFPSSSTADYKTSARLASLVTTTPLLREQFFGLAEGQNWRTGYATSNNSHHNRGYKFEKGESLEDVHSRAREIVQRCVVPWLVKSAKRSSAPSSERAESGEFDGEHVVLVAHGIMISELLFALSRLADPRAQYVRQSGHTNTGWTRLVLSFPSNFLGNANALPDPILPGLTSPELPPVYNAATGSKPDNPVSSLPKITIRKTHINVVTHLEGLKRTKGGVGSEGFDARQKSLRDFFAGGGSPAASAGGGDEDGEDAAGEVKVKATPRVPDPPVVDLTEDDDGVGRTSSKTSNGDSKRGIRIKSPVSPSPKKGRTG